MLCIFNVPILTQVRFSVSDTSPTFGKIQHCKRIKNIFVFFFYFKYLFLTGILFILVTKSHCYKSGEKIGQIGIKIRFTRIVFASKSPQ